MSTEITTSNLVFTNIDLPTELTRRSREVAVALIKSGTARQALRGTRVLKCHRRLYAFEKFPLILALNQVAPNFSFQCTLIPTPQKKRIKELIVREIVIASLSSVDAILIAELQQLNLVSQFLRKRDLAQLLRVHRSTLYKHKEKFASYQLFNEQSPSSCTLSDSVAFLPAMPTEDE